MELKSRGYAEWARYIKLGYHPKKKESNLKRWFGFLFFKKRRNHNV